MGRIITIGDIHGSYLALVALMDRINPTKDDLFIFLGDYVDGQPDVVRTLRYLIEFVRLYNCIFIMGNHDSEWGLQGFIRTGIVKTEWLKHGGNRTYEDLLAEFEDDPGFADEILGFLNKCVSYYVDNENRAFVHGGYSTIYGLDIRKDSPHNFMWDRTLFYEAFDAISLPTVRLKRYKEIYIGHTSIHSLGHNMPLKLGNLYNMDTGAGGFGRLSAMDIDTKEVWQSDDMKTYYPKY